MIDVMRFAARREFAAMLVAGLALARLRQQSERCRTPMRASPAARRPGSAAGLRGQCRRPRVLRVRFRPSSRRSRARRSTSRRSGCSRYNRYAFTVEGHADERGTREYNIALGARRAQAVRDYLTSRGVEAQPHAHDLLRQGAAGRGVQRHLLLVAEPPLGDGAQRELRDRLQSHETDFEPAPVVAPVLFCAARSQRPCRETNCARPTGSCRPPCGNDGAGLRRAEAGLVARCGRSARRSSRADPARGARAAGPAIRSARCRSRRGSGA